MILKTFEHFVLTLAVLFCVFLFFYALHPLLVPDPGLSMTIFYLLRQTSGYILSITAHGALLFGVMHIFKRRKRWGLSGIALLILSVCTQWVALSILPARPVTSPDALLLVHEDNLTKTAEGSALFFSRRNTATEVEHAVTVQTDTVPYIRWDERIDYAAQNPDDGALDVFDDSFLQNLRPPAMLQGLFDDLLFVSDLYLEWSRTLLPFQLVVSLCGVTVLFFALWLPLRLLPHRPALHVVATLLCFRGILILIRAARQPDISEALGLDAVWYLFPLLAAILGLGAFFLGAIIRPKWDSV